MKNEFDKKEAEASSLKREELNQNPAVTSPFNESISVNIEAAREIEEIKADLAEAIEKNNTREVFDYFDIGVFLNRKGEYGISEYKQPSNNITFSDLGIDEEKLIENVVKISGNADFRKSSLKNTGKICHIGGRADFRNSNFKPEMKLPEIDGKIIFYDKQTLIQGIFIKLITQIARFTRK